jgi:N-methylhydantoinase B
MADPIRIMIDRNLLASVAEEMGAVLQKTAFSPNIKERRDFSCAVFDGKGGLVAQAAHIPVHLGSMAEAVRAAIHRGIDGPGCGILLNDPYRGGTHLPDLTLVTGVFPPGARKAAFHVASRAHHSDIGGLAPGSMAPATEIFQEGIRIPPLRFLRDGKMDEDILALLLANVRTPVEREGDLRAQMAANAVGVRRLLELLERRGLRALEGSVRTLQDYSERMVRAALRELPEGEATFEDHLDDDGAGTTKIPIRVKVTLRRGRLEVDFTGSSPEVAGCVNATRAVTTAAVHYVLLAILERDVPVNDGVLRPVTLVVPEKSVVCATFPRATAAGNVETSQRIVDTLLGAFARILPDRIPAASCGTMSNLTLGGVDPRSGETFAYYETLAGGAGALPFRPGTSAVQTHMTNTLNTPVEALELAYPFRVLRSEIRRGSGGNGHHRGGDGIVREIEVLTRTTLGLLTERRRIAPYGLGGGEPGARGRNLLKRKGTRRFLPLPGKSVVQLEPGDVVRIETPGGGGHGKPRPAGRGKRD